MYRFGVDSNIMSLAGLAIAIGDVGDMGIIMTENIYRHIAPGTGSKSHFQKVYEGASEVGGAIVTAVSNTLISFHPGLLSHGSGGQTVPAARLHQDVRDRRQRYPGTDRRAANLLFPIQAGEMVAPDGLDPGWRARLVAVDLATHAVFSVDGRARPTAAGQ